MASLCKQSNGRWRIQFLDGDDRKGISLGKMQKRQAEQIKMLIDNLIAAKFSGLPIDQGTSKWISGIDEEFYSRIAAAGLLQAREQRDTKLDNYIGQYIESRPDVKPATKITWGRARKHLVSYFGAEREIKSISSGEARDFYLYLQTILSDNTVRRTTGIAKQFFQDAVDRDLISKNVFKGKSIPTSTRGNAKRQAFITRETADKILKACPNAEWRLIFALSRFGGLRCPSEHLALRWEHLDLDGKRLTIPSPKTERHEGGESRVIPLFPEIEVPLNEVALNAKPGNPWIITRYREPTQNMRTQFERILTRAGVKAWPKLFQNLRSTRETELIQEGHNPHVVCAIIGNSMRIMHEHYWQNTDSELDKMLDKIQDEQAEPCAYRVQQVQEVCSIV